MSDQKEQKTGQKDIVCVVQVGGQYSDRHQQINLYFDTSVRQVTEKILQNHQPKNTSADLYLPDLIWLHDHLSELNVYQENPADEDQDLQELDGLEQELNNPKRIFAGDIKRFLQQSFIGDDYAYFVLRDRQHDWVTLVRVVKAEDQCLWGDFDF